MLAGPPGSPDISHWAPAALREIDPFLPERYWPVIEAGSFNDLSRVPATTTRPRDPGPRADIHDKVRFADHLLVMFHHDHRIAQIPQTFQGFNQPPVIPLVQPDTGFIQDIQNPHQRRTDLGGQADPLRFSAGEGPGGPVQGQIIQADID